MTDFRKKLKDGKLLVGTLITLTAPEVIFLAKAAQEALTALKP
jgi:hypothetical protein